MSAELEKVEAANQEFYVAFETGDLDRMASVWAEDDDDRAVTCVHPGSPMLRGRTKVLRSWALIMANTPYIQFVLTDVQTRVFGSLAVVTCSENILTASDAPDAVFAAGAPVVATNAFVRTPEGWRLWLHHGSPVLDRGGEEPEE